MIYTAIGLMSGSSLDGLDIACVTFFENGGKWNYEIQHAACMPYTPEWEKLLRKATTLSALDYQLLHTAYGRYLGEQVNTFIEKNNLQFKIALVASHGHTTFHVPEKNMTAQLGDGAALAAITQLPVVSDLRAMDVAFGGQGAPIVPIGEKLLLGDYDYFLNIGGIANISCNTATYTAFDICAANSILNRLAGAAGKAYDEGGNMARSGTIIPALLQELNALNYYQKPAPKSLANSFGTDTVYPILKKYNHTPEDLLRTYTEHIAVQIKNAIINYRIDAKAHTQLLVTGGGAFNTFLIERVQHLLQPDNVQVVVPDEQLVQYKEALIMALMGVLRWREAYNVLSSVTGAQRDSVGGAMWIGGES